MFDEEYVQRLLNDGDAREQNAPKWQKKISQQNCCPYRIFAPTSRIIRQLLTNPPTRQKSEYKWVFLSMHLEGGVWRLYICSCKAAMNIPVTQSCFIIRSAYWPIRNSSGLESTNVQWLFVTRLWQLSQSNTIGTPVVKGRFCLVK